MPGAVSFREADDIAAGEPYPCGGESPCDTCSGFPLGRNLPPFDFLDCARVNLGQPGKVFLFPVEPGTGSANLGGGENGQPPKQRWTLARLNTISARFGDYFGD